MSQFNWEFYEIVKDERSRNLDKKIKHVFVALIVYKIVILSWKSGSI